jgi:integrase
VKKDKKDRGPFGRRKIFLPQLELTRVVSESHPQAIAICHEGVEPYYVAPITHDDPDAYQVLPKWTHFEFPTFPVPIGPDGVPWAPGVLSILGKLEEDPYPTMGTYGNVALDLALYHRFLIEHNLDWQRFPKSEPFRPTYRFRGWLLKQWSAGLIAKTTAKRCMGNVVGMYRRFIKKGVISPDHAPWKDQERLIDFETANGRSGTIKVTSTDLAIEVPENDDDDYILDGERMKPLTPSQQEVVAESLSIIANTEMTLMHLISFATGARLQSVCTLRLKHIRSEIEPNKDGNILISAGPGTGIDTKYNRSGVLHFPLALIEKLRVYASSQRALTRRALNGGGDGDDQFVFLSKNGEPYYDVKSTIRGPGHALKRNYLNRGGSVQQFIREHVLPTARRISNDPGFDYTFHWLRATFAMNLLDAHIELVNNGQMALTEALEIVRKRMWHKNINVTLRYLNFRQKQSNRRAVQLAFEVHLKAITEKAMKGLTE